MNKGYFVIICLPECRVQIYDVSQTSEVNKGRKTRKSIKTSSRARLKKVHRTHPIKKRVKEVRKNTKIGLWKPQEGITKKQSDRIRRIMQKEIKKLGLQKYEYAEILGLHPSNLSVILRPGAKIPAKIRARFNKKAVKNAKY